MTYVHWTPSVARKVADAMQPCALRDKIRKLADAVEFSTNPDAYAYTATAEGAATGTLVRARISKTGEA